jgi:hypothetical protein
MRYLIFCFLALFGTAQGQELTICYNYGCAVQAQVVFSSDELVELDALFDDVDNAGFERGSIQLAVGFMSRVAGKQTPIHNDKGGNYADNGVDGRMDCIDHSRTTTAYLKFMAARGLLHFHRVLEPIRRAPLLVDDHWSARIEEKASRAQYAVDSWFFDNGEPARIFPLNEWLKGAKPHD